MPTASPKWGLENKNDMKFTACDQKASGCFVVCLFFKLIGRNRNRHPFTFLWLHVQCGAQMCDLAYKVWCVWVHPFIQEITHVGREEGVCIPSCAPYKVICVEMLDGPQSHDPSNIQFLHSFSYSLLQPSSATAAFSHLNFRWCILLYLLLTGVWCWLIYLAIFSIAVSFVWAALKAFFFF